MTKSFRERHPGPWTIAETTGDYRVERRDGVSPGLRLLRAPEHGLSSTGHRNLSRSEALALAEAICGLAKPAQG